MSGPVELYFDDGSDRFLAAAECLEEAGIPRYGMTAEGRMGYLLGVSRSARATVTLTAQDSDAALVRLHPWGVERPQEPPEAA